MNYEIVVESSADDDIDRAYRWLKKNLSPEAATLWYIDIFGALESLKAFPARCARAPEARFFKEEIRQLLCGKYRILFELDGDRVRVLHVRHSARKPLKPTRRSGG